MALFRKKTTPAELAAISDEISMMKARLDEADEVKAALLAKLADQAARDERLAAEHAAERTAGQTATEAAEAAATAATEAAQRADRAEQAAEAAEAAHATHAAQLDSQAIAGATLAPPTEGSLGDLRADVDALAASMAERMDVLDTRMTSISTELANQLTELSGELDRLLDRRDDQRDDRAGTQPIDETHDQRDTAQLDEAIQARLSAAIDEIEASTTRLASEQARYQIQFRQDLAELAERLRRPPAR